MSLLSYFLYKTHVPEKFESVTKYTVIDGIKMPNLKLNDLITCESFELGHRVFKQDELIMYETFFSNGTKIVRNHLSKHNKQGNLIELFTYFGDNDKFDNTFDVCYIVDVINDIVNNDGNTSNVSNLTQFWDEIVVNPDDNLNITVSDFTPGFLISQNQTYNPKKIQANGKTICDIIGENLEICYVDYLKYENLNIIMYCQKYNIEQEVLNNINKSASDIAKRKIVGHCVMTSNENLDDSMMAKVIISALNFDQKKYEDRQKKELLRMYAQAYVTQNPKKFEI